MNWKAEAVDKLKHYDEMFRAACSIPEEIKALELSLYGVQGKQAEKIKVKGGKGGSDRILDALVYREELRNALERAKLWLSFTDRALDALKPEDRLILQRMYVFPQRGCLQRLTEELGVEQSTLYRRRDKALERFTIALYGLDN